MKLRYLLLPCAVLLTGCFAPKNIEFGQRKVRALPEYKAAAVERQKQAALFVDSYLGSWRTTNSDPHCALREAQEVSQALSSNLGAPAEAWGGDGLALAAKLRADENRLDRDLDKYRAKTAPDVGKKIEGTGWFQIGFFSYYLIIAALLCLAWGALKVYGWFNPAVALGTRAVGRVGRSVVQYGFGELIEGGQRFKERLEASGINDEIKGAILDMFDSSHREMQSRDTQDLVKQLKP